MGTWWSRLADSARVLRRNRRACAGLLGLLFFLAMATVGPRVVPLDMTVRYELRFQPPSLAHPMGTDALGRDLFTRVLYGGRVSLTVGVLVVTSRIN